MKERALLGKRLKTLRKGRRLTQERLAKLVGISSQYLSRVETGRENPTLDLLVRLARVLKVALYEIFLFEYEGEQPEELMKELESLRRDEDVARMSRVQRREFILTRFGARVRELRRKQGWTQEELAKKTKRHRTYIAGVERGERNITIVVVEDLAQALGVQAKDLFIFPRKRTEQS